MRLVFTVSGFGWLAAILVLAAPSAEARAPRYAVVNAGPADYHTARQLLRLYKLLSPKMQPTPAPPSRPGGKVGKSPAAARKSPGARAAAPKVIRPRLSSPIQGRALRRALVGLPHDEAPSVAAAALRRGKRLYSTLKRAQAAESFARAISTYDAHVAWSQAQPALVEAHTYLLLCNHALGKKAAALKVAARLRELTGNKIPKGVPVGIWTAYPLVPLPLSPRRKIEVKVPAKAQVFLDDQPAGLGPQVLSVGPGAHRVRVESAGHRVFHQVVAAGPSGQKVLVSLVPRATDAFAELRKDLSGLRSNLGRRLPGPIKKLAKRLRLDQLLVCSFEGGSLKARWYSARLGKFASSVLSLPRPGAGDLRKPVLAAFAKVARAERLHAKTPPVTAGVKSKAKPSVLWKKWYFWVAAAVVAGVVGAFAIKDSLTEEKVILRVTRP